MAITTQRGQIIISMVEPSTMGELVASPTGGGE
jgi:hypothetical protein